MEEGGEGDYIPIATLSPPECTSVNWCFTPSQPVRLYQGEVVVTVVVVVVVVFIQSSSNSSSSFYSKKQ